MTTIRNRGFVVGSPGWREERRKRRGWARRHMSVRPAPRARVLGWWAAARNRPAVLMGSRAEPGWEEVGGRRVLVGKRTGVSERTGSRGSFRRFRRH